MSKSDVYLIDRNTKAAALEAAASARVLGAAAGKTPSESQIFA